jgi:EAL domain-containing protein (putative c-di-GMP-specific phosphodiesterase class I)
MDVEGALWRAVDSGELEVHFQPVVDLHEDRLLGAEALVRWRRPGFGLLPPSAFIPVAEQSRLITVIDSWVLWEACRQAAVWPDPTIGISVNLSTRDVRSELFLPTLRSVLQTTGIDPGRLTLELTETAVMSDAAAATEVLGEAEALGVRTAIDDFGAGYWSMSHLRRLPVHTLKIDQGIAADVVHDPTAAAITRAITAMGHALGLRIVAEGIENARQARALTEIGCDGGQGFWFSPPHPGPPRRTRHHLLRTRRTTPEGRPAPLVPAARTAPS